MGLVSAARNISVTILFLSFSKSKYCHQFFHGFREFFNVYYAKSSFILSRIRLNAFNFVDDGGRPHDAYFGIWFLKQVNMFDIYLLQ